MRKTLLYAEAELLNLISTARRDQLKEITEYASKSRDRYGVFTYSKMVRAIAQRLRELGSPVTI
jgi:hypothetical protein